MKQELPQALIDFDQLPNSAFIRVNVLAKLIGCSIPTVWRKTRNGSLPQPVKFSSHVTSWNVGAIREALREIQTNSNSLK